MWVAFANAKATHIFFSKNISIYAIFNDQSFNDTLTNDIVSFEQLGSDPCYPTRCHNAREGPQKLDKIYMKKKRPAANSHKATKEQPTPEAEL